MEVVRFEDIQDEFMARAQQAVYCNVATIDSRGRPRSRVMHVVWDGPIGWVITSPESHKRRHLEANPYVSLAYISNAMKPIYVDCRAEWVNEVDEKVRVWELHKTIPPPLGRPHLMGRLNTNISACCDLRPGESSLRNSDLRV